MANVLKRDFDGVRRNDTYTIIPIGDIHIGAAGCDEDLLRDTVKFIKSKRNAYWIGMGDYIDAINMSDPRFDAKTLAPWIKMVNLADLAGAQLERFIEILSPIADKCLCMLTGNHEDVIKKYYERDVYSEIVTRIKLAGGFPQDHQMKLDYYGWLRLSFHSKEGAEPGSRTTAIDLNLHHGFGGGKLAGAKALADGEMVVDAWGRVDHLRAYAQCRCLPGGGGVPRPGWQREGRGAAGRVLWHIPYQLQRERLDLRRAQGLFPDWCGRGDD